MQARDGVARLRMMRGRSGKVLLLCSAPWKATRTSSAGHALPWSLAHKCFRLVREHCVGRAIATPCDEQGGP